MAPRFLLLPSTLLAVACGGFDQGVKAVNNEPRVTIASPSTGESLPEGVRTELRGAASDLDDAPEDLLGTWLVDGSPIEGCEDLTPDATGIVTCDFEPQMGQGTLTLEVRDPANATGTASVTLDITPTEAPTVDLISPDGTGVYYSDQLLSLEALALDAEDEPSQLIATWESDRDGPLDVGAESPDSSGALAGAVLLSEGDHTLTLTITDSSGKTARDSVRLSVGPPNSAPACTIVLPADGSAGEEGATVLFEAVATDADIPAEWLTVAWTSDKDGALGTSTPDSAGDVTFAIDTLTVATHTIQMRVSDELGALCTASILYTVGTPPTLVVTAPTDGTIVNEGSPVRFSAQVSDSEDSPTDIDLLWESDVDGIFSTVGADSSGEVDFTTGAMTPGAHFITVRATDTAGLYVQETFNLTINQVPNAASLSLSPSSPDTDDALVATASGSFDPDGFGTLTYVYEWYKGGVLSSASTSDTLPASATAKNESWTVVVTPTDGYGDGPSASVSVTIQNAPPVLTGPSLSASTLAAGDTLTATHSASDADGDSLSTTHAWTLGSTGAVVGTGSSFTLAAGVATPGDTLIYTVSVDDGDGGTDVGTATATITNTAPVVASVSVTPSSATVGSTLTCAASASDADGPVPTVTYAWTDSAGASLGSGSTLTLTTGNSDPGDSITCTATATDSSGATDSGAASATVLNSTPVISGLSISPSTAYNTSLVTCNVSASDADAEALTTTITWVNTTSGATIGSGSTLALTSTLASSLDGLRCDVSVADPSGGTATNSTSLILANREPSLSSGPTISPASPVRGDTLTCSAAGTDADADSVSLSVVWTVGGTAVGTGSTYSGTLSRGQTYTCTVTPDDGKGSATGTAGSASVTIGNTAPKMSAVSLAPTTPYTNDTLTATASATDVDGDSLSLTYAWYVNGSLYSSGSSNTLSGSAFSRGNSVYVVVTPNDGTVSGSPMSSSTVTVANSAPTAPVVAISPVAPVEGIDNLVCGITTASTDADSDAISYSATWTLDGVTWSGSTSTAAFSRDTIPASVTAGGDVWVCTVTPTDGTTAGSTASASVTVESALPDLIVDATTVTVTAGAYEYDEIMVINGGTLYINDVVELTANSFYVESGATVSGNARGGAGGTGSSAGSGTGRGGGSTDAGGGGAGHGGAGGRAAYDSGDSAGTGGSTYGSTSNTTTEAGSGGGAGSPSPGGAGGAAIKVVAADIVVDGTITMDGAAGTGSSGRNGGGGSGGGILLIAETIDFTGLLSADGGNGGRGTGAANDDGGGGGGGIIKVFYDSALVNTGSMTVTGGTAGTNGDIDAVAGSAGASNVFNAAYP